MNRIRLLLLIISILMAGTIFSQRSSSYSLPVTVIDSSTKEPLDSVWLTIGKYGHWGKIKGKKMILVDRSTKITGGYAVIQAEKTGYRTISNIGDQYFKLVNYGKMSDYVMEIPMAKIKKGVKLIKKE